MQVLHSRLAVLILALLVAACASTGSSNGSQAPERNAIITQEQLNQGGFANVYDAVQALHGNWLRARGADSFGQSGQVQVYMDGTRVGGVENLRSIRTVEVAYVRFYDGITAGMRWGLGHQHGVIYVSSRPE